MDETHKKFVDSMLESSKKKFDPMPPEKRRELSDKEMQNVEKFTENLRRGIIKR